ncbi:MAG: PAS domain-containing protein, partial [Bacteroidota bacterium]
MNHPKSGLAQDRLFGDLKEQSLMATLLAHSPAAIAMTDVNMNYLLLSQRWCEDYGLREQDCLSQSHYEAFPFLSQQWQNHYEACLQGEIRQGRQDEIIRPDGRKEWIKWEIRPWFENDDKVGGLIIFTELITGLVEAQARNEAMNQLLKSVISHTREQISIIDLQGNLLLGASPEQETSSSNIFDSLSIGQQQLLKEGMQRVQQSKQAHIYQSASHIGEGTTHWFDNCLSPLEDSLGEVTHFVLLRHDITRLVDATEKIRASEHQLRMIYEATSDYIYVLSPEGKIEFVNRSFPPASPNDLLGTYLWDTIPQLEREGVIQKFDSALALQRTVEYESELQLDNGMTIYLRNQLFPVKDALGKVERLILFAQDVSPI